MMVQDIHGLKKSKDVSETYVNGDRCTVQLMFIMRDIQYVLL